MQPVEKYSPIRVNKDDAPGSNRGGNREFRPGEAIDMLNCRYLDNSGKKFILKNTPGNVLKMFSLPSNDNIVIGAFPHQKENTVIYHVWNSGGDHRVIEWDSVTNVFTVLLQGSSLGYSRDFYITQGGTIDDLHIWNDRFNRPRKINIVRARAGGYTYPYSQYDISLVAKPPLDTPTVEVIEDIEALISQVSDDTFQFTHRYIYINNEQSTFGPLSKVAWPGLDVDPVLTTFRAITVSVPFFPALVGIVKKIEFAYRRGNNGNYTVFKTVIDPTGSSVNVIFRNNEDQFVVSEEEETRPFDDIPDKTQGLAIIDSRVLIVANEKGFDENPNATFAAELIEEELSVDNPHPRFLKEGGIYGVAPFYVDDFGKRSFVEQAKTLNVPFLFAENTTTETVPRGGGDIVVTHHFPLRKVIQWTLSGTPPPYAKKYGFALSRNRFYANHFSVEVYPHLYVRNSVTGEDDGTQTDDAYFWQGKMFRKLDHILDDDATVIRYKLVYLQLPVNIPFIPDTNCFVRFTSKSWPATARKIVPIINVIGGFIVIDLKLDVDSVQDPRLEPDHFLNWKIFDPTTIEVFLLNTDPDPRFYEIGELYDVVAGAFPVLSGKIYGDTYNFDFRQVPYQFNFPVISGAAYDLGTPDEGRLPTLESPTGIIATTVIDLAKPLYAYKRGGSQVKTATGEDPSLLSGFIAETFGGGLSDGSNLAGVVRGVATKIKTLDYTKASSDFGRTNIEKKGAKKKDYFSSVSYTEQYVQDSDINGITQVRATNRYPIAVERSPIRSLVRVGNVLLAIHERNVTSLYLGEGIVRQAAGNGFLAVDVEKVIGDDRELGGRYGTVNPESIVVLGDGDLAMWWDGLRGAIVQYSKAGLYPVSAYKMSSYFRAKAREYFPYRDQVKIISGYDDENKEVVFTFPEVKVDDVVVIAAVTWAFHIEERCWTTRYSYVPEFMVGTDTFFVAFKAGQLYLQNRSTVYNNFFGVQYPRQWRFATNYNLGKAKKYLNVHLEGTPADDMTGEFIPVRVYTKEGQESYIPAHRFTFENGKWSGPILKDINTPGIVEPAIPLNSGDDLLSNYLEVEVINDRTDEAPCEHVNVVFHDQEFSV